MRAIIRVPGLPGEREALCVPGSPDCISIGELCVGEQCDFRWPAGSLNPTLTMPDGEVLRMEVDNNVPYFVPEDRPPGFRRLAARGYVNEVRRMENMTGEQLQTEITRSRQLTEAYASG